MAEKYKRLTTEYLPKEVDEFSKKYCRTIKNEVPQISKKRRPPLINFLVQKLQALRTEEERKGNMAAEVWSCFSFNAGFISKFETIINFFSEDITCYLHYSPGGKLNNRE